MTIKEALKAANEKLMPKVNDVMEHEVFQKVQEVESATIDDVVYGVYKPKIYSRRGDLGGMADPYNIEMVGGKAVNGRISVVNVTDPNPGGVRDIEAVTTDKNLPELIEYGQGYKGYSYDFGGSVTYHKPRPFTQKTIENLENGTEHIAAFMIGMNRRGVKIE